MSPAQAAGSSYSGGYQAPGGDIRALTRKAEADILNFTIHPNSAKLRRDFR